MSDWVTFVRLHLDLSRLTPAREAEIVEDVARQLEDVYLEAIARGESEERAITVAGAHIADWQSFASDIYRTNRHHFRSKMAEWTDAAESRAQGPTRRSGWLAPIVSGLGLDAVQTFRELRKQPVFALVVIATLALGIGANTAIFSLLDQVLLRPLPVTHPEELVLFSYRGPNSGRVMVDGRYALSYPMYKDLRDGGRGLVDAFARFQTAVTIMYDSRAERVQAELVSGNYFDTLGLTPSAGRLISATDDVVASGHPFVVLSHGLWVRRFGRDPGVVGRTVRINGHPMTVIGIGPAGFAGTQIGAPPDLYVPITMKAAMTPSWDELERRRSQWLQVMGRLRPGVSRERAEAAMAVVFRQVRQQEVTTLANATESRRKRFVETPLTLQPGAKGQSPLREQFSTPLVLLMGMVGLVLLIACANVANLLMARAPARQREVAVRLALGASGGRIVRRLLVESVLLAAAGALVGLLLAAWTSGLLLGVLLPGDGARSFTATPDGRVLGFAALVSLVTALVFGLVPALQAARPQLVDALKEEGGRVVSAGHTRLRRVLVVAQVALSLLLLIGAGLFGRTLWNLRSLDPGFDTTGVITFSVDPSLSGYDTTRTLAFYQHLQEELRQLPGVTGVSLGGVAPFTNNLVVSTIKVEGYQSKDGEDMNPHVNAIGPGYFRTLGMTLVAGRDFTNRDIATAQDVAIISETMARLYFGKENPIGRRMGWGGPSAPLSIDIVGVAKDSKDNMLRDDIARVVYTPYAQDSELNQMTFFVRATGGVRPDSLRQVVERADPGVPVFDLKSMDAQKTESLFIDRMVAILSVAFGVVATLLAAMGIYAVMSYTVARRTREIGVRMALGAARGRVVWLIMRDVLTLTAVGACVGLPAALAASRLVESQLFGLSPVDPPAILLAVVSLFGVAVLAGYLPASRASRVDPLRAIRQG